MVSIITITRNRAKLIGRCIGSVLSQSYHNIEHIVVDGASDDNTGDVIASFVDDRLKYLKLDSNWSLEKTYKYGTSNAKASIFVSWTVMMNIFPLRLRNKWN